MATTNLISDPNAVFFLQIIDGKGDCVCINGGSKLELELVDRLSEILADIPRLATRKKRRALIRSGIEGAIMSLKQETVRVI